MLNVALAKGRLAESCADLFIRCGIRAEVLKEETRKLVLETPDKKFRFFFVKPSDVPTYVEYGIADIGIVGKDTLLEAGADLYEMLDLKFEKLGTVNNEIVYDIYFLREKSKNKFYLGNESEGIRKVINLMLDLLEVYEGKTIVIDELDSSISTISLIKLFNNFINVDNNIKGQLIVTSHNLFLFDNNIFEPQQIYIVNKKEDLSSELYSLAEFKIRSEKENLYHDFLKGKYGGING